MYISKALVFNPGSNCWSIDLFWELNANVIYFNLYVDETRIVVVIAATTITTKKIRI